jgi:hypothetical protein
MLVWGTYLQVKLREIDIPVKREWPTPKPTGLGVGQRGDVTGTTTSQAQIATKTAQLANSG